MGALMTQIEKWRQNNNNKENRFDWRNKVKEHRQRPGQSGRKQKNTYKKNKNH
jgi:hypothetical protein